MVHDAAHPLPGGEGQLGEGLSVHLKAAVQVVLHQADGGLIHLLPLPVHQLDAVVVVGVVGGGDHHAAVKAVRPGDVGHGGGGGDVEQVHVRPGGRHARADGVLQHIAGAAGVLAYHDPGPACPAVVPAQEAAHLIGVPGGQIHIGLPPEAVGAEVFSHLLTSPF